MTKKGKSKLIDSFPLPNIHVLYLMMSTLYMNMVHTHKIQLLMMKLRKNGIQYNIIMRTAEPATFDHVKINQI
jgi:hypothetical protein